MTDAVARLKKGNVRAFDEVYEAYRPRLHSFLLRLSGRRDVAEDLLQETFIKLARDVYRTNAERFAVKREIDQLLGSAIMEVKSYQGESR